MLKLAGKRLAAALPNLIGVVIVTFLLTRALPGDAAAFFAGPAATPEAVEEIRRALGLDRSLPEQFFRYVGDLVRGDLGQSISTGQPVVTELISRLPASLELTLFALLMSATITGSYLIDSVLERDRELFWAVLKQLLLPAITLALFVMAPLARMTRASMLGVLSADFVRTARASGLTPTKILYVFAFRNALLPIVTTLGMVFSFLLGSNVLVEKVFAWPGIGSYALEALVASDYAPVQGFVLAMATLYVLLNLAIDILYGVIDPRVSVEA